MLCHDSGGDRYRSANKITNMVREQTVRPECPPVKFRCGQTAFQYWASLFREEPEGTKRNIASKKDRPTWYNGEVVAGPVYKYIVSGGARVEDHCYVVH